MTKPATNKRMINSFDGFEGPLNSGIKNYGGIGDSSSARTDTPTALVRYRTKRILEHEDPGGDKLGVDAGYISYWGEAKPGNSYNESEQNAKTKAAFDRAAANKREEADAWRRDRSLLESSTGQSAYRRDRW